MTHGLRHKLRQLLPPSWWCWSLIVLWLGFYLAEWVFVASLTWYYGASPVNREHFLAPNFLLGLGLVSLAMWRAVSLNPVLNPTYREWLEQTPWTATKPLPLGTVLLTAIDVTILCLFVLAWTGEAHRLYLVLAFFLPYCVMITVANFIAQSYSAVYCSIGIASLLPLVGQNPWLVLAVSLALYASCHWGFQNSLRKFPWTINSESIFPKPDKKITTDYWPMVNQLSLSSMKPYISWQHIWGISLMAAWLAGELTYLALINASVRDKNDAPSLVWLILLFFSFLTILQRTNIYLSNKSSPLGLFGRLATGRIIIPQFDKVLLAPFVIAVAGCLLPAILIYREWPLHVVMSVGVFVILFCAIGLGPSLANWNLTGNYKISISKPDRGWEQL